jgi:hypothetical protein
MSRLERQRNSSGSGSAAGGQAEVSETSSNADLRSASYEEGAEMLKPGTDPAEAEAARLKRAQESWEKLFGDKIGGELFALVSKHLSASEFSGYAHSGVKAIAEAAGGLVKPSEAGAAGGIVDTKAEAAALNKLIAALAKDVAVSADAWLESEKGQQLAQSMSQWVQEHPGWTTGIVVTSAITAAVVAYLQNVDIPELEQTFKLGDGLTASAALDLGKIQSLSIQAAKATLAYQTEGFQGSVTVAHDGEKDVNSVTAKLSGAGALGHSLTADGKADAIIRDDGSLTLSASGGLESSLGGQPVRAEAGVSQTQQDGTSTSERVTASVRLGEDGANREYSGHFDRVDDTFELRSTRVLNDGATSITETVGRDATGMMSSGRESSHSLSEGHNLAMREESNALGGGQRLSYSGTDLGGPLSFGLSAGTGTLAGMNANLDYNRGDVEAALDLEIKDQISHLSLSAGSKPADGWSYGANAKMNLSDSRFEELGTNLGWQHPTEFKSFALGYKAKWLEQNPEMQHHFDSSFEYAAGRVSGRLTGSMDLQGRTLMGTQADLLMGYQLNPDWTALAGVGYQGQRNADTHHIDGTMSYQSGVQYKKNIAFTVGYTPESEEWRVGIVIPLGL